jgi:hypothetical protein
MELPPARADRANAMRQCIIINADAATTATILLNFTTQNMYTKKHSSPLRCQAVWPACEDEKKMMITIQIYGYNTFVVLIFTVSRI